jgi:hypothetical protein
VPTKRVSEDAINCFLSKNAVATALHLHNPKITGSTGAIVPSKPEMQRLNGSLIIELDPNSVLATYD